MYGISVSVNSFGFVYPSECIICTTPYNSDILCSLTFFFSLANFHNHILINRRKANSDIVHDFFVCGALSLTVNVC